MAFFKRSQKQNPEMKNYEHFSNLGDNEEAWAELNDKDPHPIFQRLTKS